MDYKQREKRVSYGVLSISGYKDLSRVNSSVQRIHFRKFVSSKLLGQVLGIAPKLRVVSFSKYALARAKKEELDLLSGRGIEVRVSKSLGRPSYIERVFLL